MPQAATRHCARKKYKRKFDPTLPCRQYHRLYTLQSWQDIRLSQLSRQPLCAICLTQGKSKIAKIVDHIEPHKGDLEMFYDSDNLQSLCKKCHDAKTWKESIGSQCTSSDSTLT